MPKIRVTCLGSLVVLALLAGCQPHKPLNYAQQLLPGEKALRKLPPERYPDFTSVPARPADLIASIDNSLSYLSKPSSRDFFPYLDITHDRAVATLRAMRQVIANAGGGPIDWNRLIRDRFEVYQSIGAPNPDGSGYSGEVLFTGYCTPIYDASLTHTGPFQWPLYKRPKDMAPGEIPGSAPTYYARAQIEGQQMLAGQELVWLKSRWEAYVVTIQGSARLRLSDGRKLEVGYNGTNNYPYVSPGKQMIADGVIPADELNLTTMRRYFDVHPEAMDKYLWLNPRTVFFSERPGGPFGKLNVPVTPFATIATDKEVYPRAMPAFVTVPVPSEAAAFVAPARSASTTPPGTIPFRGFLLDQDSGGAIRAAGRCDLYMGIGPEAEQMAGHQTNSGQLYYIAIKPELIPQSLGQPQAASALP